MSAFPVPTTDATIEPLLPIVGADLVVPLAAGGAARYVNLDYAASAPCLAPVRDAIEELLPWYSSVHRGAGYPSVVSTRLLAGARRAVSEFLHARSDDLTVFTRNTTDSLNLLASSLPDGTTVICFSSEHHANLLPWRRGRVTELDPPASAHDVVPALEAALRSAPPGPRLIAVTGASNVTGEIWPLEEIVAVARRHGARVVVDAAQLAPHRPIDIEALDIDYLALSAHKLYAPFGAGVLVGRADWLETAPPYLAGGGAVRLVTTTKTEWASGEARHEAGTPNLVGAVALAAACVTLRDLGMDRVRAHESALLERLRSKLARIGAVETYAMWGSGSERIGVVAFNLGGWHHGLVAAALSAEYGIGVRDGAFCAHPLVGMLVGDRRLGATLGQAGAVRASLGVGSSSDDVDRLVAAVARLADYGPAIAYELGDGRYVPAQDLRGVPGFLGRLETFTRAPAAQLAGAAACEAR